MDATDEGRAPDSIADALRAREALTALIVAQVEAHGYYLAHVDPQPHQHLVDLRWAAQVAGRVLGRRTRTHMSAIGAHRKGRVTVLVAPDEVRVMTDERGRTHVRAVIDDVLERQELFAEEGPATA